MQPVRLFPLTLFCALLVTSALVPGTQSSLGRADSVPVAGERSIGETTAFQPETLRLEQIAPAFFKSTTTNRIPGLRGAFSPAQVSRHSGLSIAESHYLIRHVETRLPRYSDLFLRAELETGIDWRLLAAVAYQESLWDHEARSPTGVRGLMMLTNDTAAEMGVAERTDPRESALGGAAYLRKLMTRFRDVPQDQRLWFALAAYNAGYGHIRDAMRLTVAADSNAYHFASVTPFLMQLQDPDIYPSTRHGYARGARQAVIYVERVRKLYLAFQLKFEHQRNARVAFSGG